MNITPVLNASVVIQLHLLAALLALGLGAVQLAAAKGTASHRRLGYLWAGMMAVVHKPPPEDDAGLIYFCLAADRGIYLFPWSPLHQLVMANL